MSPENKQLLILILGTILAADGIAFMVRGFFPKMKAFPFTRGITRGTVHLVRTTLGGGVMAVGQAIHGGKPKKKGTRKK